MYFGVYFIISRHSVLSRVRALVLRVNSASFTFFGAQEPRGSITLSSAAEGDICNHTVISLLNPKAFLVLLTPSHRLASNAGMWRIGNDSRIAIPCKEQQVLR